MWTLLWTISSLNSKIFIMACKNPTVQLQIFKYFCLFLGTSPFLVLHITRSFLILALILSAMLTCNVDLLMPLHSLFSLNKGCTELLLLNNTQRELYTHIFIHERVVTAHLCLLQLSLWSGILGFSSLPPLDNISASFQSFYNQFGV